MSALDTARTSISGRAGEDIELLLFSDGCNVRLGRSVKDTRRLAMEMLAACDKVDHYAAVTAEMRAARTGAPQFAVAAE